jgi:hypothetical protein
MFTRIKLNLLIVSLLVSCVPVSATPKQKAERSLTQQASTQSPEWDDDDYHQFIWKTPNGTKSPLGWISVTNISKQDKTIDVELDNAWINERGTYAHPKDKEAQKIGHLFAGTIKSGQTRIYEVAAGPHEIATGNMDFQMSPFLNIDVNPGQTVRLVCGRSFHTMVDIYLSALSLAKPPRESGKYFYFLRRSED